MHTVDHRTNSHRTHHSHRTRHVPTPIHKKAVEFLQNIQLAIDPGVPPPPLFPFIPFQDAVRAWLASGGGSQLDAPYWAEMRNQACVAFLGNIPMGTETAEQRPQPIINLPLTYFQQQSHSQQHSMHPSRDISGSASAATSSNAASTNSLPDAQPILAKQSSSIESLPSGAPSLLHASSLLTVPIASRGTSSSAGSVQGELLLFPPADSSQSATVPLRIQTPPLHMGLGMTGAGGGQLPVGAHLFHNPLMFPSTLAVSELTRSATAVPPGLAAPPSGAGNFHLPGLTMGRATTEYPSTFATSRASNFTSPILTPHQQLEAEQKGGGGLTQQQTDMLLPVGIAGGLGLSIEPSMNHLPDQGDLVPSYSGYSHPHQLLPPKSFALLRPDGTGHGLLDHDAVFLNAPSASASQQQHEDWEHLLISRGLADVRTRKIFTSGQVSGARSHAAPMMISSLIGYVASTSSASSEASTPTAPPGRSRSGSIGDDALHHLHRGAAADAAEAATVAVGGSVGVGAKNTLLSFASAALLAHQEELDSAAGAASSGRYDYDGIFGKRKGTSYGYLLPNSYAAKRAVSRKLSAASSSSSDGHGLLLESSVPSDAALHPSQVNSNDVYDPFFLDDPNIKSGRHRVVLNLPGFMSSLISYVKQKELKQELNETFAARHEEWLDPTSHMTLSKIRKCKELLLDIGMTLGLEISTVACSYIYFEKLILSNSVSKSNRKLMAAVCLLLAYKWSEGSIPNKKSLGLLFHQCEKILDVNKSSILKQEFPVYVLLGFNLMVKTEHVLHHFRQCLAKLDTVPQDYLHIEWSL